MKNIQLASMCHMGAYSSFIAGIAYVLVVLCAFFSPDSIVSYIANDQYFKDFSDYRTTFFLLKGMMVVANLSMIGVVVVFYSLHRDKYHGVMAWISTLAIIGFGVGLLQSIQDMTIIPYLADQYQDAGLILREMMTRLHIINPNLYILSLGLPGIWFMLVSFLAFDNPQIPRYLVLFGFVWGIGNLVTVVAHLFVIISLIRLVSLGALIAAPIWSIGEGLFLLKLHKRLSSS